MRRVAIIAATIALADQLTKLLVAASLEYGLSHVVIPGFFNLVHWRNSGAAWGMMADYNVVLAAVSLIAVLAMYLFRHTFQLEKPMATIAIGLILGGIIGNAIDRFRLGYVVDFLDFYIAGKHWPAFNVADSAICIGVCLYIIATWQKEQPAKSPA